MTAPNNDGDITVTTPSNKTLTFTTQNYNTAQTVTVSAADDNDVLAGVRAISHTTDSTDHAASWSRAATNHSGTTYTLTDADAGLPYIIGIQATNAAGASGWKNSNTVPAAE